MAGLLSALGIGVIRGGLMSGDGGIAGFVMLFVLGVGVVFEIAAGSLLRHVVRRVDPGCRWPTAAAVGTLALGAAGMIALNRVLVAGPDLLHAFGSVSTALLSLPYPLASLLLLVRRARVVAGVGVVGLVLAVAVVPLRTAQEHLAARAWRHAHPQVSPALLQGITWPGGKQSLFETGSFGVRTTVFFQDGSIDGESEGVVTVSPLSADPCGPVTVLVEGEERTLAPQCSPVGSDAWTLKGSGFKGYAVRRNGVLLRLSVDTENCSDDLPAIADTLHRLDDHALWPYLSNPVTRSWLLS